MTRTRRQARLRAALAAALPLAAALLCGCPSTGAKRPQSERPYTHTISSDDEEAHKETGAPARHTIGAD
ncbi:MAG: hypothetical protein KatS3mg102_1923 [Planctomycetota bacterium]|nr:MAG: hypothetical protein KatS3mg102_1923 [Planctomycetota bacterium]